MTYEEAVAAIMGKRRLGSLPGVEAAGRMLELLGNPQAGMRLVHIAGTNGKGSVSAFLCSILGKAGVRAGMFTSPHLVDFAERIRVDGVKIGREDVARLGTWLLGQDFGIRPTMFDYCLVMAVLYFKEQGCEVMIAETGLGGRLDATNALGVPEVSVITKIGYDHMELLGNTLGEIAAEKAGILKEGTRLILEGQKAEADEVIRDAARRVGLTSVREIRPAEIKDCQYLGGEQVFSFRDYEKLRMRMLGTYQYENAAAAILAAEAVLGEKGPFVRKAIFRGIAAARWPGRMEILREEPFFLVDGAHNPDGTAALRDSLMALFPGEKFHFVMGVMADKDYGRMAEILLPLALDFRTVTVEGGRALGAEELAACIRAKGVAAECAGSIGECLSLGGTHGAGGNLPTGSAGGAGENLSMGNAGGTGGAAAGKTVAFGSLYFIGEVERLFR